MRKKKIHKNPILIVCIILVVCISGCITPSNSNDSSAKKETLVWGVLATENIYPLDITNDNYWTLVPNIFNGLVDFDENFRIIPSLATSWNNPDSLTWRFFLRQGVKFHNGDDFTAEDVKYSFETYNTGFRSILNEIIIQNPYTIEFKTNEPFPGLLSRLAHNGIIYCRNITEENGKQPLIGTGPYQLSDYNLGNYTTLERFNTYWGETPVIRTVRFVVIEDTTKRINALRSGTIDIAEYNVDDSLDQLLQDDNITVVKYPPLSTYIIGFDMRQNGSYGYPDGRNPTADVRVRKAIYQTINITPLINGPFKGLAQPESQFITPYIFGYNPKIKRLPYNATLSRQLLAEAGYESGFNITMDCITEGYPYNAENCYLITQQLASVGIHVTMNNLSIDTYDEKVVYEKNTSMYLIGYGTISVDGGWVYDSFIRSINGSLGFYNSGHYSNPTVDQLGAAASHEMDAETRLQMLQEGFEIALVDDIVVIPLFSQELLTLTANNLEFPPRADLRSVVKDIRFI
jgi:peptide/nickel transport system substrate-binding protein